jgi:hypothetical protein
MQTTPDLRKQHLLTTRRKIAQAITPVTCSLDVLDLIDDRATNYPEIFRVFPQSLQRLYLVYDTSFHFIIHHHGIIQSQLVK